MYLSLPKYLHYWIYRKALWTDSGTTPDRNCFASSPRFPPFRFHLNFHYNLKPISRPDSEPDYHTKHRNSTTTVCLRTKSAFFEYYSPAKLSWITTTIYIFVSFTLNKQAIKTDNFFEYSSNHFMGNYCNCNIGDHALLVHVRGRPNFGTFTNKS